MIYNNWVDRCSWHVEINENYSNNSGESKLFMKCYSEINTYTLQCE